MRRVSAAFAVLFASSLLSPAAAARAEDRCAQTFPEAAWESVIAAPVAVSASGVLPARQQRFAAEAATVATWIAEEMGPVEATVCLVGGGSAFDPDRLPIGNFPFHAALLADDDVVVISTDEQLGRVGAAAAFGLAHLRLWQESGGTGWPEPLAGAVAHWYRNRLLDRLELRHADARIGNMFSSTSEIDWNSGAQSAVLAWDPSQNDSAIGDLIAYTVAEEDASVLLDPDPDRWAQREARWRTALRVELTGREDPTTTWVSGVVITVVLLLVATGIAAVGFWSKRRMLRRRPTPPPVPGFFTENDRPAESTGERR